MRKIGELPDKNHAIRFCDYLLTKDISAMTESTGVDDSPWAIWIRDEDALKHAREQLQAYQADPESSEYQVEKQAEEIRKSKGVENQRRLDMQQKVQGASWSSSGRYLTQKPRLTLAIVIVCVLTYFVTDQRDPRSPDEFSFRLYSAFLFVDFQDYQQSEGDVLASVKKGELWRVFTPNLLHGNMMHLAFNMLALFFLGGAIERLQSPMAAGGLVLFTGVVAIVVQCLFPASLGGSPHVVGISGAVYGLFGYLWIRPILQPSFPNLMPPSTIMLMLAFLFMFILLPRGAMGMNVANVAHVAGLIGGILCATAASHFNT